MDVDNVKPQPAVTLGFKVLLTHVRCKLWSPTLRKIVQVFARPKQGIRRLIERFAQRSEAPDHLESPMSRKSIYSSPGEPSFFYLMMAGPCFRGPARNGQAGTLRNIGRSYLTKATKVTSALESQPSAIGRAK